MKTIKLLMEYYECKTPMALRLQDIYLIGLNHGKANIFPDGNFAEFPEFLNGVGHDIKVLQNSLNVENSSIFDIYDEGHDEAQRREGDLHDEEPAPTELLGDGPADHHAQQSPDRNAEPVEGERVSRPCGAMLF